MRMNFKRWINRDQKNKARLLKVELCYIDGLVSTGNQIPYTILKINFANQKIFLNYFIHILNMVVDKGDLNLPFAGTGN
jgi:hypothetical protein